MRAPSDDEGSLPVLHLGREETARLTDALAEAFHDYPVMRFVLGSGDDYRGRLRRLVGFFVSARALRDEPMLGVEADAPAANLVAGALVSFPGERESHPELGALREEVWAELGSNARTRYETCGRVWKPLLSVDVPHIHLNMIGVRPAWAGRGLGRRLMDHVHAMSRERPRSEGVTLTTEDPDNVGLYEHLGYRLLGHARIAPGIETWSFLRRD